MGEEAWKAGSKGQQPDIADNVVVDKAKISCSYAQSSRAEKSITRLVVKEAEDGRNVTGPYIIATEKDCKRGENLFPFQRCYSPYYVKAAKLLYGDSPMYEKCRDDYTNRGYGDCLHLLEEVWFQPSEKLIVSNMYNMENRILKNRTLQNGAGGDIRKIRDQLDSIQTETKKILREERGTGYCYDLLLEQRWRERKEILKGLAAEIEEKLQEIEACAQVFGYAEEAELLSEEFLENYRQVRGMAAELDNRFERLTALDVWDIGGIDRTVKVAAPSHALKTNAESPERTPEMIAEEIKKLPAYGKARDTIQALLRDLDEVIESIGGWTDDCSRTLTTDSFMVCRCGGLLEFQSSGQEFTDYFNSLYIRTLELTDALEKYYRVLSANQDLFGYESETQELKYAYGYAADSLEKTYKYLSEGVLETMKKMPCNVHLEFVAKSVKEEEQQYLSALITIAGFIPGPTGTVASLTSSVITIFDALLNKDSEAGTADVLFSMETVTEETGTMIMEKSGKQIPAAVTDALSVTNNISNIYSAFDLLSLVNYEIHDNWVESVRVYVFTDEYLFYAEQLLDKNCKAIGEPRVFAGVEKKHYVNERRGSNVPWGEDPGLTYGTKIKKGDDKSSQKMENNNLYDVLGGTDIYG